MTGLQKARLYRFQGWHIERFLYIFFETLYQRSGIPSRLPIYKLRVMKTAQLKRHLRLQNHLLCRTMMLLPGSRFWTDITKELF